MRRKISACQASIDRAYATHDPACVFVEAEPLFQNLRRDPRYAAFLR